ncbi:AAA family ATPase [Hymenobacter sediminicola]|uniref:AAA family ATPase n=1 Tax=Hymenobacter sediminicola TaxID=2761579 RepID=A0A7G7W8T1_9BACT|nr:AAA family ATPase [Hymenobacter sediminicola]QNH62774.1 AAA family ATPase [Hymenobacter sediminicola]
MNFYRYISNTLKRKIASLTIASSRTSILRSLPQRHPETGQVYAWSNSSHKSLLESVIYYGTHGQPKVSKLLLDSWYQQQKILRRQVSNALREAGYSIPAVPSQKPAQIVKSLIKTDVLQRGEEQFFYPAGSSLMVDATDEEVTLMAALLGWSAIAVDTNNNLPTGEEGNIYSINKSKEDSLAGSAETNLLRGIKVTSESLHSVAKLNSLVPKNQPAALPRPDEIESNSTPEPFSEVAFEALEVDIAKLADKLLNYEQQLRLGRIPLSIDKEVDMLAEINTRYQAAITWFNATAALHPAINLPVPPPDANLNYLRLGLTEVNVAHQQAQHAVDTQQKALEVLALVHYVRHQSIAKFNPLADVYETANTLSTKIAATPPPSEHPSSHEIATGTHPLALLVAIAASPEKAHSITDDGSAAQALYAALSTPVVIALLRGNLYLASEEAIASETVEVGVEIKSPLGIAEEIQEVTLETAIEAPHPVTSPISEPSQGMDGKEFVTDVHQGTAEVEEEVKGTPVDLLHDLRPTPLELPTDSLPAAGEKSRAQSQHEYPHPPLITIPQKVEDDINDPSIIDFEGDIQTTVTYPEWLVPLQWDLLEQRRFALAWRLTEAATGPHHVEVVNQHNPLPAWLLKCLAVTQELRVGPTTLSTVFSEAIQPVLDLPAGSSFLTWQGRAVVLAAALWPALVAPITQAQELLRNGLPGFANVNNLCLHILTRNALEPLQPALLQHYQTDQQWQQQLKEIQTKLNQWADQYQHAEFRQRKNHPITVFWRHCLKREQPIGQLLNVLTRPAASQGQMDTARRLVVELQNEASLQRKLHEANLELAPNRHVWPWFRTHLAPLLDISAAWLDLQAKRPTSEGIPYQESQDQEFCRELTRLLALAQGDIVDSRKRETASYSLVALELLANALDQVQKLLGGTPISTLPEPSAFQILTLPLFRSKGIELGPTSELVGEPSYQLSNLQQAAKEGELSWVAAYQYHLKEGNFQACQYIRSYLPALRELGGSADFPRQSYLVDWRAQEQHLTHAINLTAQAVETGVRKGYISEQMRAECSLLLDNQRNLLLAKPLPETLPLNFPYLHRQLKAWQQRLETTRESSVATVSEELARLIEKLPESRQQANTERVARALSESSVSVAHHYVAQLMNDVDITTNNIDQSEFKTFFVNRFPLLESALTGASPDEHVKALREGKTLAGQDLESIDEKARLEASQALIDWQELRANRTAIGGPNQQALVQLLKFVGFPQPELVLTAPSSGRQGFEALDVEKMFVRGKDLCPIAAFASDAKGAYRLLLVWTRVGDVEELFERVDSISERGLSRKPIIVFYFHALNAAQRNDLASLSRERKKTFLVFDRLLLLYLATAGLQRPRLPLFFQLTLPFTYVKPYITGGSNLPPEMFYGREEEKMQLRSSSSNSSCLVYGGRQLGKTAILRDIQREFHCPEEDELVLFLDIRLLGFEGHPIKNLVEELVKLLQNTNLPILPTKSLSNVGPKKVLDYIRRWIQGESKRRMLLFLDEADQFLNQDAAQQFEYTNLFKSLMDDTDRRFKVVFSGTHNVQRTYRLPNQPLSQLGTAVCIGPLIANYEARQAEELVRRPLESLGFEFEKDELVTEILVATNYFPSLIQLFCDRLLTHLYTAYPSPEAGQRPYYCIREHDVTSASIKARGDIRAKFLLTLDLNPRFKLLAYLLASHEVAELYSEPAVEGLTNRQLHEAARDYWPAAFGPHSADADFQILLEEVEELSIATRIPATETYHLRTPNLRQLLGTLPDIERELSTFHHTPIPGAYQADLARDFYGGTGHQTRLPSPLTASQYAIIRANGTTIIRGSEAAGLKKVEDFLKSQGDIHFVLLKDANDEGRCRKELEEIKDARPNFKTTVVLVRDRYSMDLVKFTVDLTRGLTSDMRRMHVVFLMDPAKLLRVLNHKTKHFELFFNARVNLLELHAWQSQTLTQWMKEAAEIPSYTARIRELTGGWYDALFYFLEHLALHDSPADSLELLEAYVQEHAKAAQWGILSNSTEDKVLRILATFSSATEALSQADLEGFLPEESVGAIASALKWAEILGLVVPAAERGTIRIEQHIASLYK